MASSRNLYTTWPRQNVHSLRGSLAIKLLRRFPNDNDGGEDEAMDLNDVLADEMTLPAESALMRDLANQSLTLINTICVVAAKDLAISAWVSNSHTQSEWPIGWRWRCRQDSIWNTCGARSTSESRTKWSWVHTSKSSSSCFKTIDHVLKMLISLS